MGKTESELTPLTGDIKSRKYLVLDIESKDGDSQRAGFTRPFMVGVYDGDRYHAFFDTNPDDPWESRYWMKGGCVDRAMRFICRKKYSAHHIYAHYAGRFDYLFLLPWLMVEGEQYGLRFRLIPVSSAIQVLDVWRGKEVVDAQGNRVMQETWRRWRFLDSIRLIPIALDKAAKTFGLKGKLQHDLNLPEWDPSWIDYNSDDCTELYQVMRLFHHYVEKVLLGEVGITAPSTAMKLFRRRYLNAPLPREVETHDFVRASYCGGRVEVFKKSGENLRYYDINSSYPAAMLDEMPAGESTWWEDEPPARFFETRVGFVEADVFIPEGLPIPPLPVRGTGTGDGGNGLTKGKLIFPVGRVSGIWEWSELENAVNYGAEIVHWKRSVWYKKAKLFEQYVKDLYRYRDKSQPDYDEGLAAVVKIMLNSTYGKFGMKTLRKKVYRWDDPKLPKNAKPAQPTPDSLIWYAEEESDACYVMPQIAARVTSLARVRLYRYMMSAIEAGGEIHYCDTDSLITEAWMPSDSALGALKDEYPDYSGQLTGKFLSPKMYMLQAPQVGEAPAFELVKAKGIQRDKLNRKTFETLEAGGTILMSRLEKVGSLARVGFQRGPQMLKVPKRLLPEHGKRIMHKDGSTSPFVVKMW